MLTHFPGSASGSVPTSGSSNSTTSNTSGGTQHQATVPIIPLSTLRSPSVPTLPTTLPELPLGRRTSSLLQLTNAAVFDGESEPIMGAQEAHFMHLQFSRSSPGLSRTISEKFSSAFLNNETVIHRPKLSARPSVQTAYFDQKSTKHHDSSTSPDTMSDVPSLPSQPQSVIGSSNGPFSQSTAPTSLVSSGAPMSAETTQRRNNDSGTFQSGPAPSYEPTRAHSASPILVFPRQDAPRLSTPSVATMENAAAAKVFFESYFNQLLTPKVSPRSMRRHNMERKLFAMALSCEQRQRQRKA